MARRTATARRRRHTSSGPTIDELVEHVDDMHATDARYRRLSARVRRAQRKLLRHLDDEGRRAYLALEEAVNERDTYRLDSVAQFAFALGHHAATQPARAPRRARTTAVRRLRVS